MVDEEKPDISIVVLASFGGPEAVEDVLPFLHNVTRGTNVPPERLREVAGHYFAFKGVSPLNAANRRLRSELEEELVSRGAELPVVIGNRNWQPYLQDVLAEVYAAGHHAALVVPTSAYSGFASCRQYQNDIDEALEASGLAGSLFVSKMRPFSHMHGFWQPFARGIAHAYAALEEKGIASHEVKLLFSTHSIPVSSDKASGPGGTGAYVAEHHEVIRLIMETLCPPDSESPVIADPDWDLVFQSRSGPPAMPWLEPDINDVIAGLPADKKAVVVAPIGFISDHMEVAWDLDTQARKTADDKGLEFIRVATPGTDPQFAEDLARSIIHDAANPPARCPDDCCLPGARPGHHASGPAPRVEGGAL